MKLRYGIAAALVGVTLSVPAAAQDNEPLTQLDTLVPEMLFKGIVREDDVTLLFKHLRESMAAAARGEAARESEALERRAQEIGRDMAARGGVLMDVLLSAFEKAAKQAIREGFSGSSRER